MKTAYIVLAAALALSAAALAGSGETASRARSDPSTVAKDDALARANLGEVTTTVRNGDSFASVTQSGDPDRAIKHVETRPGYTRLEQRSGNSRAVVVQSDDPADLPLDKLPPAFRDLFGR